MVTLAFPLWLIFQNPNRNILIVTTGGLTEKFGIKIREYVREYGEHFNCYLSDVKQASTYIMFCDKTGKLYKGSIRLTGMGGSVTGQDADVIILDDPYKGLDEEFTPTALQKKIDYAERVLEQRIEPHTRYCVLHTRWNPINNDCPVLTTKGWKTHGTLKEGDYVYNPQMKPVRIKQTHPTVPVDNLIKFNNGEEIICGDDHIWQVTINGKQTLYTTKGLTDTNKDITQFHIDEKTSILCVEKTEAVKGNCITIDSNDGMYLIGETLIPTHNSHDLIGHYRETQPHLFKFINFSAIQENGEPLWKEKYTITELLTKKQNMGDRMFSAIYQQIPLDMTSDFFKMENIKHQGLDEDETIVRTVRSWDIAGADNMKGDYTCGALLSLTNKGNILLHNLVHGKFGQNTSNIIRNTAVKDGTDVTVLLETGVAGAGYLLFQSWKEQLKGFRVEQCKPVKSKVDRATPLRNLVFDGCLKLDFPLGDGKKQVLLDEFASFPNGEHDDIVDSVAWGVNWLKFEYGGQRSVKPGLVRIRR